MQLFFQADIPGVSSAERCGETNKCGSDFALKKGFDITTLKTLLPRSNEAHCKDYGIAGSPISFSGLAYYRHQYSQRPKLAASLLLCITWMLRSINGGGWTDAISNLPARGNSITRDRNSYGDESISLGHQQAHCIIGIPSLPWIDMFVNFAKMIIPVRCFTCGEVIGNKWDMKPEVLPPIYDVCFVYLFLTPRLRAMVLMDSDYERKRKRTRKETPNRWDSTESCEEGKIFSLLQMREKMLKLDHNRKRAADHEDGKGLHLIHLLLISATSINENNISSAVENLCELYQNVCLTGDSVQRVAAAYFADGLMARLLTRNSPFYDMIMKGSTPDEEFLAFTELYKVSPFYQFAHFTANQAILEAFEREENTNNRALHVIDFDISFGFQWPSLMQSLSENATPTKRVLLKMTGFGRSLEELQETESRLVSFAKGFRNIVFEFHGLLRLQAHETKAKEE
ncbi:protein SCARECROW [Sesamum angolense]|uniref:Protein SCARECROW n=1 Tax=Sesamum angolense TaxID=2727404 RepID=A0AAE2BJ54_9LAMI|nr:protein SCARECROW [Sesamum angolense]